jgi:hypothetical protein
VNELLVRFWIHVEAHYREPSGKHGAGNRCRG